MILAALGDIHGNLPALEAVLGSIRDQGIQTIVNTGDNVVGGPRPDEVIRCLREARIPTVQGENDRLVALFVRKEKSLRGRLEAADFAAIEETYRACSSENLEYLRALPRTLNLTLDGVSVAVCHAAMTGRSGELARDGTDQSFQRQREVAPVDIIVCGRTHECYSRTVGGTLFVNPGSVGENTHATGIAHYAIVSTEDEPWLVEHRHIVYTSGA